MENADDKVHLKSAPAPECQAGVVVVLRFPMLTDALRRKARWDITVLAAKAAGEIIYDLQQSCCTGDDRGGGERPRRSYKLVQVAYFSCSIL